MVCGRCIDADHTECFPCQCFPCQCFPCHRGEGCCCRVDGSKRRTLLVSTFLRRRLPALLSKASTCASKHLLLAQCWAQAVLQQQGKGCTAMAGHSLRR